MSKRVEFIGGPWDGDWRVLHEGNGIVLYGPLPLSHPDGPGGQIVGQYRPLRYYGDGHYLKWYPDVPPGTEKPKRTGENK